MSNLWIPAGTQRRHLLTVPESDVRLSDGRMLKRRGGFGGQGMDGGEFRTTNGMFVLATIDDTAHGVRLHVSVSFANHDPSWSDIRAVKDAFFGDTDAAMILPKAENYVNVHEHCFHLWELPVEWGMR